MKRQYKAVLAAVLAASFVLSACGSKASRPESDSRPLPQNTETAGNNAAENTQPDQAGGSTQTVRDVIQATHPAILADTVSYVYEETPSVPAYSVSDLSEVANMDRVYFTDAEKALLKENLFMVEQSYSREFFDVYEDNRYENFPSFVTVDSLMHTYHLYFSNLMKKTEKNYLAEDIAELSKTMWSACAAQYEQLKGTEWEEAARRNVAFFTVGQMLSGGDYILLDDVRDMANADYEAIMNHSSLQTSAVTGQEVDFTQFIVRGYYEGDEQLERYFRTMMWYGLIGFLQNEEDLERSAVLMTFALKDDGFEDWNRVYQITSFFAGASDDLGYYEYEAALDAAYGEDADISSLAGNTASWSVFRLLADELRGPAVNANVQVNADGSETVTNKAIRFMGQRFTVDASVFSSLTSPQVGANSAGEKRGLPDVLDVAAAMGSEKAYELLADQGDTDYARYPENLQALKEQIASSGELWELSLYGGWLHTLSPLLEAKGEGWPSFMTGEEWQKKDLESFAGSYTELKHDTVLYAKQNMAEMGGDDYSAFDYRGYVEPEPVIYGRFVSLAEKTADGLQEFDCVDYADIENLNRLADMASTLLNISVKELRNEALTDEEYTFIYEYGGYLEHFWKDAVLSDPNERAKSSNYPSALVTDISTDAAGTVLEAGTGNPSTIYVIAPVAGKLTLCSGSVFTFYQFKQPMADRLTDSSWRQMMGIELGSDNRYDTSSAISQPWWTDSYRYVK